MKDRRIVVWRVILAVAALLLVGSAVRVVVELLGGVVDLIAVVDLVMGVLLVTVSLLNLRAIARQRRDAASPPARRGR